MCNSGDGSLKHHVELKKPDRESHAAGVCPFKNKPNSPVLLEAKLREEAQGVPCVLYLRNMKVALRCHSILRHLYTSHQPGVAAEH